VPDVVGQDTLIEGDLPEGAANYGSLATFAAKTEEDWEDELRGTELNRWGSGGFLGGLFEGLAEGKPFVVALIEAIIDAIFPNASDIVSDVINAGSQVVNDIIETVTDAFEWIASLFGVRFNDTVTAQVSANNVNSRVTALESSLLASDVSGGVTVSDQFTAAAANDLGVAWTRTSDGAGAGGFGPNGSGKAVWKKSGGLSREHRDRYNTPLATDYQSVAVVVSKAPESSSSTLLIARANSAATEFVWALIGSALVRVGKFASGTSSVWASQSVTVSAGDQFTFLVGTSVNDRQVIVRQNGVVRITHTDTTSSAFGASYRYVGLSSIAVGGVSRGFAVQFAPAELEVWSAADRLPGTT
jgi:hypothetical protein